MGLLVPPTYLKLKTCSDLGGSWISYSIGNSCNSPSKDITLDVTDSSDKPGGTVVLCCK